MITMKLKAGIIGVGIQGENHVKVYKIHPSVEVVAIADIKEEKLKEISSKYGIEKTYKDYREMLEKEELDIVSIATPDFLHLEPSLAAIEAGCNIILEKPMAMSYEEARKIAEKAEKKGVRLYINFSNRFNPPFAIIKKAVSEGKIGKPLYGYFRLSDTIYVPTKMLSWASKTSVVYFLMSHTADLARWIFSDEVEAVTAFAQFKVLKSMGINVPDYVVAVLEFSQGAKVVLESSWILPESLPTIVDFRTEIIGEKGVAYTNTTFQSVVIAGEEYSYPAHFPIAELNERTVGFVRESIHHFIDSILTDSEPIVKPWDGVINTLILESITKSYKEGKKIKIEIQ